MNQLTSNNIDMERITEGLRNLMNRAYSLADGIGHKEFLIIHIFFELLKGSKGIVQDLVMRMGIDVEKTMESIRIEIEKSKQSGTVLNAKPVFGEQVKSLLNEAFILAAELNHVYVGTEHVLIAMFRLEGLKYVEDMKLAGVSSEMLKGYLKSMGNYSFTADGIGDSSQFTQQQFNGMPNFCRNLNEVALAGEFTNITGRDKEINRIIQILARKTKNNPILVGEAGVGKTAIIEGLVNKIIKRELSTSINDKIIWSVDISSIIAGAKLRGDVEERINNIIESAKEAGNVILFIDEIHNIVGAGTVGGKDNMDMANILKPHLTASELVVIGATTLDEYMKNFENDQALSRRFQSVQVNELDIASATQVIFNIRKDFENYHKVKIKDEAVIEAVKLSDRFIKDRFLPDKAIDLLDEASAKIKIGREVAIEPEVTDLALKLIKVQDQKNKAIFSNDLPKASVLKKNEDEILGEIAKISEGKKNVLKKYQKIVDEDLIRNIVVDWTQIPIAASDINDKTLKNLIPNLKSRIIGQDHVIENVSLAIQRSHLGLNPGVRPLASFLFLGPTGVGKTELAKSLAKELFGSADLLLQINMSEMMEMHSVSKLIGSPPGYVGFQEGGQLTKFVKRKPYCVVLFDEIEKAHPDTLNILLQILEEGALTDGRGIKVSFSNTIIVMTSNIGAEEIASDSKMGFDVSFDSVRDMEEEIEGTYIDMRDGIIEQLRNTLRPELINRIDLIDVFRGLNKNDCLAIAKIYITELVSFLLEKEIALEVDEKVVRYINEQGYSKEYGGRNIRRKVQEIVENGLAVFLLNNKQVKKKKQFMNLKALLVKDRVVFKIV
jgi:ATP-dependent Clp protease ATP-binding subunit ClpC